MIEQFAMPRNSTKHDLIHCSSVSILELYILSARKSEKQNSEPIKKIDQLVESIPNL